MNTKEKAEILDTCLERISGGESLEHVLSEFPEIRDDLTQLIGTAHSISGIPRIVPSKEFVSTSKTRLLRRIYADARTADEKSSVSVLASLRTCFTPRRLSAGLAITLAAVLLVFVGQFTFFKPAPAVAASCYLRILSGEVSIQEEPDGTFVSGIDGMTVAEGSIVTTAEDSHALLAFFDGSTIKLESGTTLELIRIEDNEDESPVIILKQWLGRTWSRVEKMTDSESRYEIETPSATAVVRGTLFATEVTGSGETSVATTEGLVSVIGENEEVFVPPSNKTTVKKGTVPSIPSLFQSVSEIRITTEGSVVGSINDPSGSSTGTLPDGTKFNQITGSALTIEPGNRQVITLTEPSSGDYNLVLRYLESSSARFTIEGINEGETVFTYSDSLDTSNGQGIIVNFGLTAQKGILDFGKVKYQFLDDESPEKLVDPSADKQDNRSDKADKNADDNTGDRNDNSGNKTEDTDNTSGKGSAPGQSKTDNTGNDNSNGNSDKKSDQTKANEDTENNGNEGSANNSVSGNADNSDTGRNPDNPNKSDNAQKDKTGNEPYKPGNSGNSDNNGDLKDPDDENATESEKDQGKDNKEDKSKNEKANGKSDNPDDTTGNSSGKKNINLKDDNVD